MVVDVKRHICDGRFLKWLVAAGLAWLEHNEEKVNRLNVFPVPDGDTGTNMRLTLSKAYSEIHDIDERHVGIVSDAVAKGALLGARGNSGVILSQILYGFSQGLRGHEVFDARLFAYACQKAVNAAYKAVIDPVEGTILTVTRSAMEAGLAFSEQSNDLRDMLEVMLKAAKEALKLTPEQLPILKKAGVVDSGGQGFVYILEGMVKLLNEEPVYLNGNLEGLGETLGWEAALEPEDEDGYGYDVQFLMRGMNLDVAQIRQDIDKIGWSTLVVGTEELIKVHVHVHDPGVPLSYAIKVGAIIDDVVVENMQQQYENYVAERHAIENPPEETTAEDQVGVITVVSGDGMNYLFRNDMGAAYVIQGGQTMNPSTEDFIAAINKIPNQEIIILPNNKNIVLAAEQAANLTEGKTVKVVKTRTIPQGVGAMIAYSNLRENGQIDEIVEDMKNMIDEIVTLEVTTSTRSIEMDGVHASEGQTIGLIEGKLAVAGNGTDDTVLQLLEKAEANNYELITLYYGIDVRARHAESLSERLQAIYEDQEVHIVYGGQPLYPYIISLE